MAKNNGSRGSPKWLVIGFLMVLLSSGISCGSFNLAGFNSHLDKFSFYVRDYDKEGAEQEMKNIKAYYNYFSGWGVKYIADRFLFSDAFLYEVALVKLQEDWEKVEAQAKNRPDDYRASYLMGVAKFRVLKAAYNSEAARKDKSIREAILKKIFDEVRQSFEKCVREGPGPLAGNFNCTFNYDLVSDPKSAEEALVSKAPGPQFVIGDPTGSDSREPQKGDSLPRRPDDPTGGSGYQKKGG